MLTNLPGRNPPLHVRGRILPDGDTHDLWIVDGAISWEPVDDAVTLRTDGWVMPALVDAHLHIGIAEIGGPLDPDTLSADLDGLARSGVGAARILGSPEPLPPEVHDDPGGPILRSAGVPLAAPDRFIPGWGRRVSGPELAAACAEDAPFGWRKIIADWFTDDGDYGPSFAGEEIRAAVSSAHDRGARVAVHTQSADGGLAAVAARADSIEHGMHLPTSALADLADYGGIFVPTGFVFTQLAPSMSDESLPQGMREWFADGLAAHADLVRSARDRGVTVLAGTDLPVGALVDEIAWLADAGLDAHEAGRAACWTARRTLGLPRLREGDRADLIWFDRDPREDLELLRSPGLVVIDGEVIVDSEP